MIFWQWTVKFTIALIINLIFTIVAKTFKFADHFNCININSPKEIILLCLPSMILKNIYKLFDRG